VTQIRNCDSESKSKLTKGDTKPRAQRLFNEQEYSPELKQKLDQIREESIQEYSIESTAEFEWYKFAYFVNLLGDARTNSPIPKIIDDILYSDPTIVFFYQCILPGIYQDRFTPEQFELRSNRLRIVEINKALWKIGQCPLQKWEKEVDSVKYNGPEEINEALWKIGQCPFCKIVRTRSTVSNAKG